MWKMTHTHGKLCDLCNVSAVVNWCRPLSPIYRRWNHIRSHLSCQEGRRNYWWPKWCVWLVAVSVLYDWRLLWCQVTGEAESAVIWGCFWISVCGSLEKTVVRWYSLWLCCTEHWVLWSTKHSRHSQSKLLISRSNIPSKWGSNFLGCLSTCSMDAFCVAVDRVIDIFVLLLG